MFAAFAVLMAIVVQYLDTMILQIAFSIFGGAGGASLGIFVVGIFCPWITSTKAAICSQLAAIFGTLMVVCGSFYYRVRAVDLPLNRGCDDSYLPFNFSTPLAGTVTANDSDSLSSKVSQISYQYYGLLGVIICLVVAHVVQAFDVITGKKIPINSFHFQISGSNKIKPVNKRLVAPWVRQFASSATVNDNPVDIPLLADTNVKSGHDFSKDEKYV